MGNTINDIGGDLITPMPVQGNASDAINDGNATIDKHMTVLQTGGEPVGDTLTCPQSLNASDATNEISNTLCMLNADAKISSAGDFVGGSIINKTKLRRSKMSHRSKMSRRSKTSRRSKMSHRSKTSRRSKMSHRSKKSHRSKMSDRSKTSRRSKMSHRSKKSHRLNRSRQ